MKSFNLSEWAVTHRAMVLFLIIATLIGGISAFLRLGRLEDPKFDVPTMTAIVSWPGASSEEIKDQVINRLERKLQDLEGIDYIRSFSRQGYGGITLAINGGTSKKKLEETWYQARKKLSDIRQDLPEGVRGPFYNDEYTDTYSAVYALQSSELSMAELSEVAEKVKRLLQKVPTVNKVDILGKQLERVYVEFSTKRLAALGTSPQAVIEALGRQNILTPAGSLDGSTDRVFVRVLGALKTPADVQAVPVEVGGNLLRLSDLATVTAGFEDPASFTVRHNGSPALAIGLTMVDSGNIIALGTALERQMTEIEKVIPLGATIEKYVDQPKIVEESIWEFESSFLLALAIVLAVSLLFLGLRTGIVVAASVPLVLGLVAMIMNACDWPLDRISLGALILALGLLVDDAIIAVEMMVVKLEQGWDRAKAATYAYTTTAFPMLTGTLVTAAGFMPVGFGKSISGQYAGGIFWIVGVSLISSWFAAVIFTPYLGVVLLPKTYENLPHHDPYDRGVYRRLRSFVNWCVKHRKTALATTVLLFLFAGAGMSLVQQQFFPTASRTELLVELRMRQGASFEGTQVEVKRLENILKLDKEIEYFTAYTGAGSPRFYLSLQPELPDPGYAQFVIMTAGLEQREAVRKRLLAIFEKNEEFPQVRGRVVRLDFGPPVGFQVQFRVMGPDTEKLREISYQVRAEMQKSPLVRDTQLDWNEQVRAINVDVDQDKARLLGLSTAEVSTVVQTVLSGATVTQVRRGEDLVDVVVRSTKSERNALSAISDVNLFSRSGVVIPLSQVATISSTFEEPVLWRRNRDMALTVRADTVDGVQGPYATQKIWPSLKHIIDALPPDYRIEQGGAIEEANKSNKALFAVFPLMIAVMLFLLMMQLQSFSRMFMVFMTAPLGLIGVVPALLIFNAPFGFVALLGVIALGGMIMRNSVILVDQIEQDISHGIHPWTAIVESTVRRARPVVLTAAAAILGMIPLLSSVFWGPMATSIMGGLVAGTALTLGFLPALYAAWFKVKPVSEGTSYSTDHGPVPLPAAS
jgi:multidrug efflux pump